METADATHAGDPYDIVLLDMCMPGTNGQELALAISADPRYRQVTLVLLTSSATDGPTTHWRHGSRGQRHSGATDLATGSLHFQLEQFHISLNAQWWTTERLANSGVDYRAQTGERLMSGLPPPPSPTRV